MTLSSILFLAFAFASAWAQQSVEWQSKAPLAVARSDHTATVLNNRVYIIGGCHEHQICPSDLPFCFCPNITQTVEVYDPFQNSWSFAPDLPHPRYRHSAATDGNKIYVIGGRDLADNIITSVDVYDSATQSWSTSPSLSLTTSDQSSVVVRNQLFVFGGYDAIYNSLNTSFSADLSADPPTFTTRPEMIVDRGDVCGVAIQDKVYVFGGFRAVDFCAPINDMEVFDFDTNSWTELPKMDQPRGDAACTQLFNDFFVIGGEQKDGDCSKFSVPVTVNERYNVEANQWFAEYPLRSQRFRFAAATIDNRVFTFGGQSEFVDNNGVIEIRVVDDVEELDLQNNSNDDDDDGTVAWVVTIIVLLAVGLVVGMFCIYQSRKNNKPYGFADEQEIDVIEQ